MSQLPPPFTIAHADCLDALRHLPDDSVTAIVTDPPYGLPGGFMGKSWDRFDGNVDVGFCYYLAGLIDGEGCFRVQKHERGSHTCTFSMKLRADDEAILRQAKKVLGIGTISKAEPRTGNQKPVKTWAVQDKEGCGVLVGFLRKFPLRAKKLRDFEAWAEAVGEWLGRPKGNRWSGPSDQTAAASHKEHVEGVRVYREIPWSGNAYQDHMREVFEECLRVVKPGGMLLAFGGTRTYHRLTCSIEDAGWQVRDCLAWMYGSGFPKSLDVSKAIDKQRYDRAEGLEVTAWIADRLKESGKTHAEVLAAFGFNGGSGQVGHWTARTKGSQPAVPTLDQMPLLLETLGVEAPPERILHLLVELNGQKGQPGENWWKREKVGERTDGAGNGSVVGLGSERSMETEFDVTAPATDAAQLWQGWGTSLKPAFEPIVLAMKPLDGTFAANALAHGVAGLNVDGCRIAGEVPRTTQGQSSRQGEVYGADQRDQREFVPNEAGRWPANVVLDYWLDPVLHLRDTAPEPVREYYADYEILPGVRVPDDDASQQGGAEEVLQPRVLRGGAVEEDAATAPDDRSEALGEVQGEDARDLESAQEVAASDVPERWMKYFERSGAALRCGTAAMLDEQSGSLSGGHYPKARTPNTIYGGGKGTSIEQGTEKYSGDKGGASRFFYCAKASKKDRTMGGRVENRHPTVKPTEIMRWLVRLVKMPEGTLVLDPFAGSGSTGVACALEGVDFLGVERDEDSHATAVERVRLAREDTTG